MGSGTVPAPNGTQRLKPYISQIKNPPRHPEIAKPLCLKAVTPGSFFQQAW